VYSRSIDGNVLTLSASGWTYDNTFVLYDYETGSLWYPLDGKPGLTCVGGVYADRFLPELSAVRLRWSQWVRMEPRTKFMACKRVGLACRTEN
jgi:hypothetical protein